jgi:hypothetical protein
LEVLDRASRQNKLVVKGVYKASSGSGSLASVNAAFHSVGIAVQAVRAKQLAPQVVEVELRQTADRYKVFGKAKDLRQRQGMKVDCNLTAPQRQKRRQQLHT